MPPKGCCSQQKSREEGRVGGGWEGDARTRPVATGDSASPQAPRSESRISRGAGPAQPPTAATSVGRAGLAWSGLWGLCRASVHLLRVRSRFRAPGVAGEHCLPQAALCCQLSPGRGSVQLHSGETIWMCPRPGLLETLAPPSRARPSPPGPRWPPLPVPLRALPGPLHPSFSHPPYFSRFWEALDLHSNVLVVCADGPTSRLHFSYRLGCGAAASSRPFCGSPGPSPCCAASWPLWSSEPPSPRSKAQAPTSSLQPRPGLPSSFSHCLLSTGARAPRWRWSGCLGLSGTPGPRDRVLPWAPCRQPAPRSAWSLPLCVSHK